MMAGPVRFQLRPYASAFVPQPDHFRSNRMFVRIIFAVEPDSEIELSSTKAFHRSSETIQKLHPDFANRVQPNQANALSLMLP